MKTKRPINIIDIIIIVALLSIVGATVYGFISGFGDSSEKATVRYVLKVDSISSELCSKVAVGDGVYDHATAQRIGTVTAVSTAQAYHNGTDPQGTPVSSPIEGKSILYITVETSAIKAKSGYTVASTPLNIGRTLDIRYPNLFCTSTCVSIENAE
ncbi:MAG: DUF4330 family protein [Clostridia bacterium]|nr:DUF4330 family protein [Clostridia bacterium]